MYEWLIHQATGDSEIVVREILNLVDADFYALIDFESNNPDIYFYQRQIGRTFLHRFPYAENGVQNYLPLSPIAVEQFDFREYKE